MSSNDNPYSSLNNTWELLPAHDHDDLPDLQVDLVFWETFPVHDLIANVQKLITVRVEGSSFPAA